MKVDRKTGLENKFSVTAILYKKRCNISLLVIINRFIKPSDSTRSWTLITLQKWKATL